MTQNRNTVTLQTATPADCPALAAMNRRLLEDEGNTKTMTDEALENRMRGWLAAGDYTAYLLKAGGETIGYALIDLSDRWMRHFYISRDHRRKGYGRWAIAALLDHLGLEEIGLSCLMYNARGLAFWRSFDHEVDSIRFAIRRPKNAGGAASPAAPVPDIVIRGIEPEDYPALLPLWNDELGNHRVNAGNIASHYDRVRDDDRYKTFVALMGGEVVGFVSSVRSWAVGFEGAYLQIIGIAVRGDMRHRGIGSRLLKHLEGYARSVGVYNIGLNTGYRRTGAHTFYQRNGYSSGNWCFGKTLDP